MFMKYNRRRQDQSSLTPLIPPLIPLIAGLEEVAA